MTNYNISQPNLEKTKLWPSIYKIAKTHEKNQQKYGMALSKFKCASLSTKLPYQSTKPKPNLAVCMKPKKHRLKLAKIKDTPSQPAKNKKKKLILELVSNLLESIGLSIVITPNDSVSKVKTFGTIVTSIQRKCQARTRSRSELFSLDPKVSDSLSPIEEETIPNRDLKKTEDKKTSNKLQKSSKEEQTSAKSFKEGNTKNNLSAYLSTYICLTRAVHQDAKTVDTLRYFRKELSYQSRRLHDMCNNWEVYQSKNFERLGGTAADDMINMTVGQTKLLTSNKFMQVSGLIDRCEKRVLFPQLAINDGSEDTKPITVSDLEDFWSMVQLQIDDVDKGFLNLERWRDNHWLDPDDIEKQAKQSKVKESGTVQMNTAEKPKLPRDLQHIIRKMRDVMRKQQAEKAAAMENCKGGKSETEPKMRKKRKYHPFHLHTPLRNNFPVVSGAKVDTSISETPGRAKGAKPKNVISTSYKNTQ